MKCHYILFTVLNTEEAAPMVQLLPEPEASEKTDVLSSYAEDIIVKEGGVWFVFLKSNLYLSSGNYIQNTMPCEFFINSALNHSIILKD